MQSMNTSSRRRNRSAGAAIAIISIGLAAMSASPAAGQCELQRLVPWDGTGHDDFGDAVAVALDTVLVGAKGHDHPAGDCGAAYVFRFDGTAWVEEQELIPSDVAFADHFGAAVDMQGDLAVVSATNGDDPWTDSGALYVFHFDGSEWVERQKLMAAGTSSYRNFGCSVAMDGDVIVTGASHDDPLGLNSGAAFVFRFDGIEWVEEAMLVPTDGQMNDYFGTHVTVSDDVILVGAWGDDDSGTSAGSAYVFRYDGASWVQEQKLLPVLPPRAYFGVVALDAGTALIGAPGPASTGAVYVFRYDGSTWSEEHRLHPDVGSGDDWFGASVALRDGMAVIGAYIQDPGAAYVFRFDGSDWIRQRRMAPSDTTDWFGSAVGLFGDAIMVGGKGFGPSTGSTFAYDLAGNDCNDNGVCDRIDIQDGESDDCDGNEVPDECDLAEPYADCNHNGMPDACDIDDGTSEDLNGDGLPDECEVDCDGDGVFDYVELEDGTSEDCDGNHVPDECEPCLAWEHAEVLVDGASSGFGAAIDLEGEIAVIGDTRWSAPPVVGSAHVMRREGGVWMHEATLVPAGLPEETRFGADVGLEGDLIVVGAPYASDRAGEARVFRRDGSSWIEEAVLAASDAAPWSYFGGSVDIAAGRIVIGARRAGDDMGAAYVFTHDGDGWLEQARLVAEERRVGAYFGHEVAIDGGVIAAAAPYEDPKGAVYVFRFDGAWPLEARITPRSPEYEEFGRALALSGSTLAIGSYERTYVFTDRDGPWRFEQMLDDGALVDALDIHHDRILVGTTFWAAFDCGVNGGAVHVYRHDGIRFHKDVALVDDVDGSVGYRVAAGDDAVLASTGFTGWGGGPVGVVAYHGIADCDGSGGIDICEILGETSDDADGDGIPDACQCPADLDASSEVGLADLLALLAAWGPCADCPEDLDGDGDVGFEDLLALLIAWGPCFDPGACCLPDGTCVETDTASDCTASGGSYLGDGMPCADVTCPPPGACCLPDGACALSGAGGAACAVQGGVYHGDGAPCADVTCAQPGACCLPDGTCDLANPGGSLCAAQGGVYHGDGTPCADVTCPQPGACCLPDGACEASDVGGAACAAQGGVYHGDGTPCADVTCPQPGACCLPDGACESSDVGGAACAAQGGVYHGDGTPCADVTCPQPGACCLPDGTCEQSTVGGLDCAAQGGVYQGDDTSCAAVACPQPGACCLLDGTCEQAGSLGGAGCAALGGHYVGDDTTCAGSSCPDAGACCFSSGSCAVRFEDACLAAGGSYVGDGTSCEPVDCTQGACCFLSGSCLVTPPGVCDTVDGTYMGDGVSCDQVTCP
jgi:hypothetical protein